MSELLHKLNSDTAILFTGGPCPASRSVLAGATNFICGGTARDHIIGIHDGFENLLENPVTRPISASDSVSYLVKLRREDVDPSRDRGGSLLRYSRKGHGLDKEKAKIVLTSLKNIGIRGLIGVGGDGSLLSLEVLDQVAKNEGAHLTVTAVPKSIDDDTLPWGKCFGATTFAEASATRASELAMDAQGTGNRFYILALQGRSVGKALVRTICRMSAAACAEPLFFLIPEHLREGAEVNESQLIPADVIVNRIVLFLLSVKLQGKTYGVLLVAEGIADLIDPTGISELSKVKRDDRGRLPLSKIKVASMLTRLAIKRLKQLRVSDIPNFTPINQNASYSMRGSNPVREDLALGAKLGSYAARVCIDGKSGHMVACLGSGKMCAIPFSALVNYGKKGKFSTLYTPTNAVDITSWDYSMAAYRTSRHRVGTNDLDYFGEDFARMTKLTPSEFRRQFIRAARWGDFLNIAGRGDSPVNYLNEETYRKLSELH